MLLFLFMSTKVMVGYIFLMPITQVIQNFGTHLAFLIQEVTAFINIDDNMEQLFNPFSGTADSRQHRHAEQLAEFYIIQRISARFQLIVHIERNNHTYIHVNQLGSEIQVTLQIGRVHYIDNDVRSFVDNVVADINFFGRISRKRISARQVHDAEVIALKVEITFFGIYGDTAVISHVLMRARGYIEKRCFTAVGISYQSHIDGTTLSQSNAFQFFFSQTHIFAQPFVIIELHGFPAHFLFTDDFNHLGFLASQGNFVSHYLILNRIFQRSIQQHLYGFSLDKTHFYNSLTETAVSQHFNDYTFFTGF